MRPPHLTSTERGTYYDSWGTPDWILDTVRLAGPIGVDLASSPEANEHVRAEAFVTDIDNHTIPPLRDGSVVFCNPPGPGKRVHTFWDRFTSYVGGDKLGAFLFFNLDHVRKARDLESFHLMIARRRIKYRGAPSSCSFPSALVVTPAWLAACSDDDLAGMLEDWIVF